MKQFGVWIVTMFWVTVSLADHPGVLTWDVDKNLESTYDIVYKALEDNRFYVVFEPDIQRNLSNFSDRWGDNYNRNKLEGIRSMIFCSGWYANEVSNKDPDLLALCPLHITLIQKDDKTRVLFSRPSVIAVGSDALPIAEELEKDVSKAIQQAIDTLNEKK